MLHKLLCCEQASLQSEILKTGGQQVGFVSLCREILTRFIKERFPTVVEGLVSFDFYILYSFVHCLLFVH